MDVGKKNINDDNKNGQMIEWFMVSVLKTDIL